MGLFSQPNFNGPNLQNPESVDGLQYGITSAGDNTSTGNAAVTGNFALIQHSVVFTLWGNPALTAIEDYTISNVSFQYGTSLSEPNVTVPEPTTLALVFIAGAALTSRFRRK